MLTGTPLDLTPFGPLVAAWSWIYWILIGGGLLFVWGMHKSRRMRASLSIALTALLILPPILASLGHSLAHRRQVEASNARLEMARARFYQRCQEAGERIDQTFADIQGIVLLNPRPDHVNYGDQFNLDDPYGADCLGARGCAAAYLFDERMVPSATRGTEQSTKRVYKFVDVVEQDGQRRRYTQDSPLSELVQAVSSEPRPRFGVLWADISTPEDRALWIAGGSLKIIDLTTGSVVAERIGFLMDEGQGSTAGFRSPWSWARSHRYVCPPAHEHNIPFVSKVLLPVKETP